MRAFIMHQMCSIQKHPQVLLLPFAIYQNQVSEFYIFCLHLQPSCFTDNAEAINFEISSNLLRLGLQEDSVYMCVYILTFTLLL